MACPVCCPLHAGDYSRSPTESDYQVVRAAVLLDELLLARQREQARQHDGWAPAAAGRASAARRPTVVAQVKSNEAAGTLAFACGARVHAIPTKRVNALRLARLVRQPEAAAILRELSDFASNAHLALHPLPSQLAGRTVAQLLLHLPDATLAGLQRIQAASIPSSSGTGSSNVSSNGSSNGSSNVSSSTSSTDGSGGPSPVLLNPPADTVLEQGDSLVLLCGERPTFLPAPLSADTSPASSSAASWGPKSSSGRGSGAAAAMLPKPSIEVNTADGAYVTSSSDEEGLSDSGGAGWAPTLGSDSGAASGSYCLPEQYYFVNRNAQNILICGWGCRETMAELLFALNSGPQVECWQWGS